METRGRTQDGNGNRSGDGNKRSREDGNEDVGGNGDGNGDGIGDGKGNENVKGWGGGGELWYPAHEERARVEDQVLPFYTRYNICRQQVALADSQQLRA